MNILIINSAEPGITEFAENIERLIVSPQTHTQLTEYRECLHIDFNKFDGVFISGSPQGDDIAEHHQPYFQWIKKFEKPVFGICAGHHITGCMYGASYLRSKEPESGDSMIEIVLDDPIFKGLPTNLKVRQMHNDSITLPTGFIHLAQSAVCFNQAMRHKDKPLYSVQFHPEYLNSEIILNFAALCKKST